MKNRSILLFALSLALFGYSNAIASQTPEEIAQKIIQQGYVDPSRFAKPEHLGAHKQAVEWMQKLAQKGSLTALADSFAKLVPSNVKLHSKKMSVELGLMGVVALGLAEKLDSAGVPTSTHTPSLMTYSKMLESCGNSGAAGICDIRQFKRLGLGNDFRRYNQDIVFLSAAYVNLLQSGQLNPGPMAGLNNNNNLVENLMAPPAQISKSPKPEVQAEEGDIMASLLDVHFDRQLGDYVNADGYKPIIMDDGSVVFQDLRGGEDVYLMFDPEENVYYEL